MAWTLHQGDCLDVLPTLADASVDAVVTDPPYIIGAVSVGNSNMKCGGWADMENAAFWFSHWIRECRRTLRPAGYLACFGNWRGLPTLMRAFSLCQWPVASMIVWDKEWIGPAGPAQLRPTYEVVLLAAMPEAKIDDRSQSDIIRCRWMAGSCRTTDHPAEKPVALMRRLVQLLSPPGGVVLDPFAGSGTTLLSAEMEGRNSIGIEREPAYCDIIRRRMADQTSLFPQQ